MNTKEIIDLINEARFLMFTLEHNLHFPAEELPTYREMINLYVNNNRHAFIAGRYSRFDLTSLEELVKDLTNLYDYLPSVLENNARRLIALEEGINHALLRVNFILGDEEQLNNLSDAVREELEIYKNVLMGGVDVISASLELPSLSSRYATLFLENRLQGLKSWLDALESDELPNMMLVQIPMRNVVHQATAEDHEEVKITKGVEDEEVVTKEAEVHSPGFFSSIAIYIYTSVARGFNNLFVHQNAAILPGGDYLTTHPDNPPMAVSEFETPSVTISFVGAAANSGCG
jgi:hypothetical protein